MLTLTGIPGRNKTLLGLLNGPWQPAEKRGKTQQLSNKRKKFSNNPGVATNQKKSSRFFSMPFAYR